MKSIKSKRFLFIFILLVLILVGTYFAAWYSYYNNSIKPLINKAQNYEIEEVEQFSIRSDFFVRDEIRGGITLATPSVGKYGGNLSILQGTLLDDEDNIVNQYTVDLTISLKPNKRNYITIYKTSLNGASSMNINTSIEDMYEVDKNMEIINKDEHTAESLELFEANKETINELRAELVDRFGEENIFE